MRILLFLSFFSCTLLSLAGTARAQTPAWERTAGPDGGIILSLATAEGVVFAGTARGGLFRSDDAGLTWTESGQGLPEDATVRALAADTAGALHASAAGEIEIGVFRSLDGGQQWTQVGFGLPERVAPHVLVSDSAGTLYAATPSNGLFQSADQGVSWVPISSGLPAPLPFNTLALAVRPDGPLFASILKGGDFGVFRSDDQGATWTEVSVGLPTDQPVEALAVGADDALFAGVDFSGFFRLADGAEAWTPSLGGLGFVHALAGDGQGRVYASADNAILRLEDDATWTTANDTLPPVRAFAFLKEGGLLAGTQAGLFRSPDDGASWMSAHTGLIAAVVEELLTTDRNTILAGANAGTFRSDDDGRSWAQVLHHRATALVQATTGILYLGTSDAGIYFSEDDGRTWTRRSNGLPFASDDIPPIVPITALAAGFDGTVYAGTEADGIYRLDGGTWAPINLGLPTTDPPDQNFPRVDALAIDAQGNLVAALFRIFVFSSNRFEGGGVYRYAADIERWEPFRAGLPFQDETLGILISIVDLERQADGTLFAVGLNFLNDLLFQSTDGETWEEVETEAFAEIHIDDLLTAGGARLFAASPEAGVLRSDDGGQTWAPLDDGLPPQDVLQLALDDNGFLYAGTDGGGVFRTTAQVVPVGIDRAAGLPERFTLAQNYPNPFNPSTTIAFEIPHPVHVRLQVYDLLGRQVATLLDASHAPGRYEVPWRAAGLASGVYLYRLEAGDFTRTRRLVLAK